MYGDNNKTPKQKVRILVDRITISDINGEIYNLIIDTLREHGFEIDMVIKNIYGLPPERELNVYSII